MVDNKWTYVSRDPLARETLERQSCLGEINGCDWCGQHRARRDTRKGPRTGRPMLWRYRMASDGGRTSDIRGRFCSVGCMRAYHG